MACGIALDELVEDETAHGRDAENGEDLERDDDFVRGTPAQIGRRVFSP